MFTVQHRRKFYLLLLVAFIALAGVGMAQQGAFAQIGLDSEVFLPLIFNGEAGGTIPLR